MRTRFLLIVGSVLLLTVPVGANGPSFLSTLHHVNTLVSTVPGNGGLSGLCPGSCGHAETAPE
jgi:hypothetical protein